MKETLQMPMRRNLRKPRENWLMPKKNNYNAFRAKSIKVRNSVEGRQSQLAWETVNEMSGRKRTLIAKLRTAKIKKLQKWKEYFKNLSENPPEINDKPTEKLSISN